MSADLTSDRLRPAREAADATDALRRMSDLAEILGEAPVDPGSGEGRAAYATELSRHGAHAGVAARAQEPVLVRLHPQIQEVLRASPSRPRRPRRDRHRPLNAHRSVEAVRDLP